MSAGLYDVWPAALCLLLAIGLAATPLFAAVDARRDAGRVRTIDGLRGVLALGVMLYHGQFFRTYLTDGTWQAPASAFYGTLGGTSVAVFFMITGHLFWSRMMATQGRPAWTELYLGRLFRIAPLYLLAMAWLLALVFWQTGPVLREPAGQVASEVAAWLSLGIVNSEPDVNGFAGTRVLIAGVTWTLTLEWMFYLSLFYLHLAARRRAAALALPVTVLVAVAVISARHDVGLGANMIAAELFAFGMLFAALPAWRLIGVPARAAAATAVIALVTVALVVPNGLHGQLHILCLAAAFLLVTAGADPLGLLSLRGTQRLGSISYGIYLLHGLVYSTSLAWPPLRHVALASAAGYWLVVGLCTAVVVAVAAIAHVAVERPGIRLGRQLCQAIRNRHRLSAPVPAAMPGA